MAYATAADIDAAYPALLDRLAGTPDEEGELVRDTVRIERALSDATATIDSYVGVRHPLPLSAVPVVLATHCVDIAVWRLAATADLLTDEIAKRAELALAWLKDLARGNAALDLPRGTPEAAAPDLPVVEAPERLFQRGGGGF